MDRIEEFTRGGKTFIYIDFSNLKTNEEISQMIDRAKPVISSYPYNSVFTITNFDGLRYDRDSKNLIIPYTEENQPYVKAGAIVGLDNFKRIMANTIFTVTGRKNLIIMNTKEEAIQFFIAKF